jgi:predicted nucleic acid-binding protein
MEEKSSEVFVDSNFFIALLNKEDSLHAEAMAISKELAAKNISYAISNLVFAEIVTVTSMKAGRATAVQGGEKLINSSRVRVAYIDENLHKESWDIFQQTEQKNISFVDCSIIAAMESEGITEILTFDRKDFTKLQKKFRFSFYK